MSIGLHGDVGFLKRGVKWSRVACIHQSKLRVFSFRGCGELRDESDRQIPNSSPCILAPSRVIFLMNSITLKIHISCFKLSNIYKPNWPCGNSILLNVLGSCMYAFDFYMFIVVTFGIVQLAWLNTLSMTSRYKNENKKMLLCTSLKISPRPLIKAVHKHPDTKHALFAFWIPWCFNAQIWVWKKHWYT